MSFINYHKINPKLIILSRLSLKFQVNKCPPKRPFFDNFDTWQKDGVFNFLHTHIISTHLLNDEFRRAAVKPSDILKLPSLVCNFQCTFLTANTIKCMVTT